MATDRPCSSKDFRHVLQRLHMKPIKGEKGNEFHNEIKKTAHCEVCYRALSALRVTYSNYCSCWSLSYCYSSLLTPLRNNKCVGGQETVAATVLTCPACTHSGLWSGTKTGQRDRSALCSLSGTSNKIPKTKQLEI